MPVHNGNRQEACDLLDNDCDGEVDEGLLNGCGQCGEITPTEICNGRDDDCDGLTDNGEICPADQQCIGGVCSRVSGQAHTRRAAATSAWPSAGRPDSEEPGGDGGSDGGRFVAARGFSRLA